MLRTATSRIAWALLVLLLCAGLWVTATGWVADQGVFPETQTIIAVSQLPRQGRQTYRLIHQGGPFPYGKDGTVFGNRERLLPIKRRGYWHEYTVRTPGDQTRGARRIVCGGTQPTRPETCYYTSDHYSSFKRIVDQ